MILSFTSSFFVDVKFHSEQGEVINKTKNGLDCRDTPLLRTFALIFFAHPYCESKFMSQWQSERAHGGRFIGKYSTFGRTTTSPGFCGLKSSVTPTFFPTHRLLWQIFADCQKMDKKSMLEVYFFSPFSTPARSNFAHFEALRVWKCNYLRLVLPQETSKVEYIR